MSSRDRVDRPARRQNRALGGPEWHLFLGSFFIYFFAWTGGEASSTWCWSGLFIDAFFFCYPLLTHVFGWKIITSWSELIGFGTVFSEQEAVMATATAQLHAESTDIEKHKAIKVLEAGPVDSPRRLCA